MGLAPLLMRGDPPGLHAHGDHLPLRRRERQAAQEALAVESDAFGQTPLLQRPAARAAAAPGGEAELVAPADAPRRRIAADGLQAPLPDHPLLQARGLCRQTRIAV